MFALRKILVPVDFSAPSHKAVEYAAFLARHFGASLELFHVWQSPAAIGADFLSPSPGWSVYELEQAIAREAAASIGALRRSPSLDGVDVSTGLAHGHAGEEVVRHAAEGRFDAIVMGTHGRSGIARMFLGSVATFVVARAPCAVMTVRSDEPSLPR